MYNVTGIFVQGHMSVTWNVYIYLHSWSCCWLHWVHAGHIYWHSCPICAHELIGTCGLYVAFEGHISFWYMQGNNVSHDADVGISNTIGFLLLRWLFRGNMTSCASASTCAGISVMYHLQCHWYYVILIPIGLHDQKYHVAPLFNCLNLRNAMMSLMTPSTPLDANASVNGIT